MQKRRKLLSLSALVCALLLVFAFVFVGCGNEEQAGGTNSGGGLDENYTSVPTTETAPPPATLSLSAATATVAYGDTLTLTATVGNVVDGTVTWSVAAEGAEAITFEEGDATDAITADSATATLTLTGAAVTSTAYNVTATFVASDNAKNTASASCAVTVGARTVTVSITGTANALYTDGDETEKSATLTATVSGMSDATITWSDDDSDDSMVELTENENGTATVALVDDALVGMVDITATVSYNNGAEQTTASDTFTISVTGHALTNFATVDFETVSGTDVTVNSNYSGVTGTLYTAGSVVSGESVGRTGYVFKVTGDTVDTDHDESFTVSFAGAEGATVTDTDTLSFSFEYYLTGNIGDWSSAVSVDGWDGYRATFLNLYSTSGDFPYNASLNAGNGQLQSGYSAVSLAQATNNTWHHLVIEMSKTSGLRFYLNGNLVCIYPYANQAGALIDTFFYYMNTKDVADHPDTFVFFGDIEGGAVGSDLYVDNLRITKNISAADLYSAANPTA